MKNTFAVTMTLLLALALGGSYAGYHLATTPHEEAAATPSTPTEGVNTSEGVPSAQSASTGPAGAPGAQGDVTPAQTGGVNAGQNGAVPASGGQADGGTGGTAAAGNTATAGTAASGTNGQTVPSPTAQGTQGTELGQTGATVTEMAAAGSPGLSGSKAAAVASASSGNTAQGQKKFTATCAGCHGADAQGGIGPALNTATGPGSWMVAQFEAAVRQGHAPDRELGPVMPHFTTAQLTNEDLIDIYAYLKTLGQ